MRLERPVLLERLPTAEKIPSLVTSAQVGDETAISTLYEYLTKRFADFFTHRLPSEADDLTQATASKIVLNLTRFDPNLGEGDFIQNFHNWTFRIARNMLADELGRRKKLETHLSSNSEIPSNEQSRQGLYTDLMPALEEKLSQLLSQPRLRIVNLKLSGKANGDIAVDLAMSEGAVRVALSRARRIIEDEIVLPAGYKRVASFKDKSLGCAVSSRSPEFVKFLGVWYTTDEMVRRYRQRQRPVDQSLLARGYQAPSNLSNAEKNALYSSKHSHLLTRSGNRVYISPENIQELRKIKLRAKERRIIAPSPGYERLIHFAKTGTEYQRLVKAAKQERLKAVKHGFWWFTTKEAVDQFLLARIKS